MMVNILPEAFGEYGPKSRWNAGQIENTSPLGRSSPQLLNQGFLLDRVEPI
jgi:hypothetical protein